MAPRLLTFCRSTRRCRCPVRRTSRTGWYTDSRRSSCEPGTAHHPAAGDRQTAPRPPVSKFPAGNTGRVYYSPSKDETRAGRRQNCAGTQAEGPLQAVVAAPSSSRPRSAAKTSETEPAGKRSPRGTNRTALHPMYKSELVRFCLSARSMKQGRCTGARPRPRSFQVGVFCRGTNARRTAVLRWHPIWEAQRTSMRTWDSPFSGLEHHPQRTLMGMAESGYVFSCGNFSNLRVFE